MVSTLDQTQFVGQHGSVRSSIRGLSAEAKSIGNIMASSLLFSSARTIRMNAKVSLFLSRSLYHFSLRLKEMEDWKMTCSHLLMSSARLIRRLRERSYAQIHDERREAPDDKIQSLEMSSDMSSNSWIRDRENWRRDHNGFMWNLSCVRWLKDKNFLRVNCEWYTSMEGWWEASQLDSTNERLSLPITHTQRNATASILEEDRRRKAELIREIRDINRWKMRQLKPFMSTCLDQSRYHGSHCNLLLCTHRVFTSRMAMATFLPKRRCSVSYRNLFNFR